jgi:hypothetical protein
VWTRLELSAGLDALFVAFHDRKAYTLRRKVRGVELVKLDFAAKIDTPRVAIPRGSAGGAVDDAIVGRREFHVGDDKAALAPVDDQDRLRLGRASRNRPVEEATITTVRAGQHSAIDRFGLLLIEEAG